MKIETQIDKMLDYMKIDYSSWAEKCGRNPGEVSDIQARMIEEYNESLTYTLGRKYAKVFAKNGAVKAFIVLGDDDKKFLQGDILTPNGYMAPRRNFARGNVLTETYGKIQWTGA